MLTLMQGDCLEKLKTIPDGTVDLVLADPPYNVGVTTQRQGTKTVNAWDKIDHYIDWCIQWLLECQRVLKTNGVLYFWHNDMPQIAQLLEAIREKTTLSFVSFCIWDKGEAYRARSWKNRDPNGKTALRSWFNVCEFCLHFFNTPKGAQAEWKQTGWERVNSDPVCYRPLKDWYKREKERLGITDREVGERYAQVMGKKPHMLSHYFRDRQFAIPTQEVFEKVYQPLGFVYREESGQGYDGLKEGYHALREGYEGMRQGYEALRREYEGLRNYHRCDPLHCNVWHVPPIPSNKRLHTCQKPVEILERLVRVSCRPGGTVLDCFMGSGSTGVAALRMGRDFIGIEQDPAMFQVAQKRIQEEGVLQSPKWDRSISPDDQGTGLPAC